MAVCVSDHSRGLAFLGPNFERRCSRIMCILPQLYPAKTQREWARSELVAWFVGLPDGVRRLQAPDRLETTWPSSSCTRPFGVWCGRLATVSLFARLCEALRARLRPRRQENCQGVDRSRRLCTRRLGDRSFFDEQSLRKIEVNRCCVDGDHHAPSDRCLLNSSRILQLRSHAVDSLYSLINENTNKSR